MLEVTRRSVAGLARNHYSAEQIAGWMGERKPAYYEDLIAHGLMVVAENGGVIVGFVDSEPGELTRLFILPDAAGNGLGKRLLRTTGLGSLARAVRHTLWEDPRFQSCIWSCQQFVIPAGKFPTRPP